MLLSECCTAPPNDTFSSDLEDGICGECGEHSEFYDEEEEEEYHKEKSYNYQEDK